MSSERENPDCANMASLIQPYVDRELANKDQEAVLGHLEGCDSCRTQVQEQQQVRAALRELEQDIAPVALRQRLILELDRIDAEAESQAESSGGSVIAGAFGRFGAMFRGTMLLAPAAAAAVALFFVVRGNVDTGQLASQSTALLDSKADSAEPPPPDADRSQMVAAQAPATAGPQPAPGEPGSAPRLEAVEGAFQIQFSEQGSLPPGIQLVSAGNAEPSRATVRLREGDAGFVDLQRPAANSEPRGKEQVFRGRSYYLSRDPQGLAAVQFHMGGVLHELTSEGPTGRRGAPVQLEEADMMQLVQLAHRLQTLPPR